MSEGHPDFKSIDDRIPVTAFLFDLYGQHACRERYQTSIRLPPWESGALDDGKLEDFDIDLNTIDRLYHAQFSDQDYHSLYGRMDYKGQPLYFHIRFMFSHKFLYWILRPETYLTFDPHVFLKSVIDHDCNPQEVWKTMTSDGLQVDEPTIFDLKVKEEWSKLKETPSLKFLCHMSVYENWSKLEQYSDALPLCLMRSIGQFIGTRQTRDDRILNPQFPHRSIHVPYSLYP